MRNANLRNSQTIPPSKDEDLVPLRAAEQCAADFERNSHEDFANVLSYGSVWKKCSHLVSRLGNEDPQREE